MTWLWGAKHKSKTVEVGQIQQMSPEEYWSRLSSQLCLPDCADNDDAIMSFRSTGGVRIIGSYQAVTARHESHNYLPLNLSILWNISMLPSINLYLRVAVQCRAHGCYYEPHPDPKFRGTCEHGRNLFRLAHGARGSIASSRQVAHGAQGLIALSRQVVWVVYKRPTQHS